MKITFSTEPLYTSGQVRLILDFIKKTEEILKHEEIKDEGKSGNIVLSTYIHQEVISSSVLRYMRRSFSEFPELMDDCSKLEELIKQYSTGYWEGLSTWQTPKEIRKHILRNDMYKMPYLEAFIPIKDIYDVISTG